MVAPYRLVPADQVPPAELHRAFGEAFSDYLIGPFNVAFATWGGFLGRQVVEVAQSRVALDGEQAVAFCFVAPRDLRGSWRLATMGVVPAARGSGIAPILLDDFIARARDAARTEVELECFAQNERAIRLYRGRGFEAVQALHGYTRAAQSAGPTDAEEVAIDDAFAWLDQASREIGDLPLQVTPPSLRAQPLAYRTWRKGNAQLIAAVSAPGRASVHSLVDRSHGLKYTPALISALQAAFPTDTIHVPQLQRGDFGGDALPGLGFEALPLHQVWMRKPL